MSDATSALDGGRATGTPATGDGPPRAAGPPHWTALLGSSGRWPVGPVPQSWVLSGPRGPPDTSRLSLTLLPRRLPPPLPPTSKPEEGPHSDEPGQGLGREPLIPRGPLPPSVGCDCRPPPSPGPGQPVCVRVLSSLLWWHRRDLAGSGDFLCPHLLGHRWESLHPAEPGGSRRRRGRRPRAQLPPRETRSRGGRGGGPASAGGCPARRERVVHQNREQRPKRVCPPSGLHVRRAYPHGAACLPGTDAESGLKTGDEAGPSRTRVLKSARGF